MARRHEVRERTLKLLFGFAMIGVFGAVTALAQAQDAQQQPGQQQAGQQQAGQQQAGQAGQAGQPKKNWKDQAEYDLFASITKETDNNKKLSLLDSWKQKYPSTDFKQERLQLYLTTYQGLGQPAKMIETAKEMLANDPKDLQALYWIAFLTPTMNNTSPEALDQAEKAGNGLLAAEKPPTTSETDWQKAKKDMEALGHKTLGWVAMQRKNNEQAEQEFTKSLQVNPNAGEVSYWLGTVILAEKKPERQSEALYHFARAASLPQSQGGLTDQGRSQIDSYFTKAYTNFHGKDDAGLSQLRATARQNAFPPADFKIRSSAELAVEKQNELQKQNPQLALWLNVKNELNGPNGEQYFNSTMKGAAVPKLKGYLVSQSPASRPTTLVLGIENQNTPEVTLKLDAPLAGKADPGTALEFQGIPQSFTKEPFMVTFDVEKSKISGWPAQAAPAPARRPVRKGAARRKG